jgi:hypothetical protein
MKNLLFVAAIVASANVMAVEETDYAKILRGNDFKYCATAVNKAANWLVGQDAGTIGLWKPRDADNHIGVLIASKRFTDTRFSNVSVTLFKVKDGNMSTRKVASSEF